jgi:hypothetical protein
VNRYGYQGLWAGLGWLTLLLETQAVIASPPFPDVLPSEPVTTHSTQRTKITFDLDRILPDGLVGSEGNERSPSYEFCIPRQSQALAQVRAIDLTVRVS